MNIFKTFENFLALPVNIIKNRILRFVLVEQTGSKSSIEVENSGNTSQFTIVNNEKVYRLLTSVAYKKRKEDENTKREVFN